ncbi:MAG: pantoate--beta-alanine ligase [Candidatus Omnitrophica bacterium]|jgi:pantoate--beta-alanine ligase|nr:pantoate--beta-alanine ligase [Candidatus Omnitrophota bacterium]
MLIAKNIRQARKFLNKYRLLRKSVGFVPTMGALHQGHSSLIRLARKENDIVAVSIFVNPAQFAPHEDLKKYPRDLNSDARVCAKEKVDLIFYPRPEEMYPKGYKTFVKVEGLSEVLCGKFRPGHFRGVSTVVLKLFNIILPDKAYFGQKDAQQAAIIKKMAEDLNVPTQIKIVPTVRSEDGLALSSRNNYLSGREKEKALILCSSLSLAREMVKSGVRDAKTIIGQMRKLIVRVKEAKIDYVAIVDPATLQDVLFVKKGDLVCLAVWIGKTRLIDNLLVD